MPIPKPEENETEKKYISRCIAWMEDHEKDKYPDRKQRIAICYSEWEEHQKQVQSQKK